MALVYAVSAVVLVTMTIGVVGYFIAKHLDKKHGTELPCCKPARHH